jgi:hypothetical protein
MDEMNFGRIRGGPQDEGQNSGGWRGAAGAKRSRIYEVLLTAGGQKRVGVLVHFGRFWSVLVSFVLTVMALRFRPGCEKESPRVFLRSRPESCFLSPQQKWRWASTARTESGLGTKAHRGRQKPLGQLAVAFSRDKRIRSCYGSRRSGPIDYYTDVHIPVNSQCEKIYRYWMACTLIRTCT